MFKKISLYSTTVLANGEDLEGMISSFPKYQFPLASRHYPSNDLFKQIHGSPSTSAVPSLGSAEVIKSHFTNVSRMTQVRSTTRVREADR